MATTRKKAIIDVYGKFEAAASLSVDLYGNTIASASCPDDAAPATRNRRNAASTINPTNKFSSIAENAIMPSAFTGYGTYGPVTSGLTARDAILLCQQAYASTAISIFRQTIDSMSEFASTKIILKGGTAQSNKFYEVWMEKIGLNSTIVPAWNLEFYRSGNVVYYRLLGTLDETNLSSFKEVFGAKTKKKKVKIPVRYLLLNPADIGLVGATTFLYPQYYKILNQFELSSLLNNPSKSDLSLIEKVPELKQIVKDLKDKNTSRIQTIKLPLNFENLITSFYHKQDYEGLSTPAFSGVLNDLNSKIEQKRVDAALNRAILKATFIITMGDKELGPPSAKQIANMQTLFDNDSAVNILVGDFTTKGEWHIPKMGELLDPKKYQIIENDIRSGLNAILFGGENAKFANAQTQLKMLLTRLEYGRNKFLNEFLKPEMARLAKELGFTKIPTPEFEPINLEDTGVKQRIYAQLAQLGLLTPEETFIAIKTDVLPTKTESEEAQREYKTFRDAKLYQPLTGGPKENANGRPNGTPSPQKKSKPAKIGTVSAESLRDTLVAATQLEKLAAEKIKSIYKIKKLTADQKELINEIVEQIVINEEISDWKANLDNYFDFDKERPESAIFNEITEIAASINSDYYSAALLYHSQKKD